MPGLKTLVFSTRRYMEKALRAENVANRHNLQFLATHLDSTTAPLCQGYDAAFVFVNDKVNRKTLEILAESGTKIVSTMSTGTNHIDLRAARDLGITVTAVPSYSPTAISEFTIGLLLSVARKIPHAYHRTRDNNFNLEGLEGFELNKKTIGVYGAGVIGRAVIRNLSGFGAKILAFDPYPNKEVAHLCEYVDQDTLFKQSDVLTFHTPLMESTRHLVNEKTLQQMKDGVVLVNTSRGAIIDTAAAIKGLKGGKIKALAIDVYEEEADLFFEDHSDEVLKDDNLERLLTFPNVLVTGHQAFLTDCALRTIAQTSIRSLDEFEAGKACTFAVKPPADK